MLTQSQTVSSIVKRYSSPLMMAERKMTPPFSFAALLNSEEKQKSAAHTSSYITWQCCDTNHAHSPSLLIPFFLPPPLPVPSLFSPSSPCPLTVKGVGQHEHSTPTVVVCCVHCTTRGSHTPGVPQCVHTQPPPPSPPGCRAEPRPKDQVLFLQTLHLGVGWLDLVPPVGAGHRGQS